MRDTSLQKRSSRIRLWAAALLLSFARLVDAAPAATPVPEYDVKAAFLFNVAKYADWPPQAYPGPGAPIIIGILGDDPFGAILDRLVAGREINQRKVIVRRTKRALELRTAHVVFICKSERDHAVQLCASFADTNVLCVGDTEQTAVCAAINFSVDRGRIVFSVNLNATKRANVRISSKLLHLAQNVVTTEDRRQ